MRDLRDHLRAAFIRALQKKADENEIRALVGLSNQINKGLMSEMHYAHMNRIRPRIEFLQNVEEGVKELA